MGKTESPYDRRIRELEEEAERIRKNMNALMKSVKREAESPRATFSTEPRIASTVGRPSTVAPLDSTAPDDASEPSTDAAPAAAPAKTDLPPYGSMRNRTPGGGAPARPQLSTYLASGSFGKGGPASRETRIQRNKAIFMAIVALLALFILISQLL